MATTIDILDRPLTRIRETCEMAGKLDAFEGALPELETHLKSEIARGETSETRLTHTGFCLLQETLAKRSVG